VYTTTPAPAASTTITTIASQGVELLDEALRAGSARTDVDGVGVDTIAVD